MEEKNQKLTYEELEKKYVETIKHNLQLTQTLKSLESRVNGLQITTMRLEYLFKVLNCPLYNKFDEEFINDCIKEVQNLMIIEEPKED